MTLTEFLLARIAEDEAAAREAAGGGIGGSGQHAHWRVGLRGGCGCCSRVVGLGVDIDDGQAPHVARHDPARVLADCKAKRRVVECHAHNYRWNQGALGDVAQATLELLALPHADHPDYDESWRP